VSEQVSKKWYEFYPDEESLEECRERRLLNCPLLTPVQLEALTQLRQAIWDGYLISKNARSELITMGLAVKWNGWQVISREGLAVLEVLGLLRDERPMRPLERP
jgi:hypothetical protein